MDDDDDYDCSQIASKVIRSQSIRAPLGSKNTGDLHTGQNLKGIVWNLVETMA